MMAKKPGDVIQKLRKETKLCGRDPQGTDTLRKAFSLHSLLVAFWVFLGFCHVSSELLEKSWMCYQQCKEGC